MPSRDFKRADRIAAELRRLIGVMVHEAVREHALPSVSVSDVEVNKDFEMATVYVIALVPETATEAVKALNAMAKDFRYTLAHQMRMRRVPEVRFRYDDSVDRGARIDELLRAKPGMEKETGDGE